MQTGGLSLLALNYPPAYIHMEAPYASQVRQHSPVSVVLSLIGPFRYGHQVRRFSTSRKSASVRRIDRRWEIHWRDSTSCEEYYVELVEYGWRYHNVGTMHHYLPYSGDKYWRSSRPAIYPTFSLTFFSEVDGLERLQIGSIDFNSAEFLTQPRVQQHGQY